MAYVVETATTTGSGTGAVTIGIGTPAQNDLILIFCGVGGAATMGTPSGYTLLYTSTNTVRQYCWYKVAGSSESAPTSTPSFSSSSAFVTVIVRDADTTTPITNTSGVGYNTSTFTNVKEVAAPTITTGVGKTSNLIIHAGSILTDSIVADFSKTTALATSSGGGTVFVAKEWVENASTASTAFTWLTNQSSSRTGNLGVVSINNKTNGLRDISCLMTNTRLCKPYPYGTSETLSAPNVILTGATPLASLGVYGTAAGVSSSGALAGSYLTSLNISTGTNIGASDVWVGFSFPTTATLNMSGKIVGFAWNPTQPWSAATTNANGVAVVFSDNAGAWVAYQVRTLSTAYLNTDHIKYISPGVTTPLGSSGTIDWTSITNITWLYARKASQTNTPIVTMHSAYLFDGVSTLIGGSATKPITASQIYKSVTQYIEGTGTVGLASFGAFQGSGQVVGYAPLQLGDGSVPTYVKLATNSYETPPSSTRLSDYYVTNAAYGITLYGSSTCTFDLRSALIASTSLQQFTIHASSNLSASMLTTGASFIGRTFSDLAGYPWTSVSWSLCDTVTIAGGGDLTTCTINQTVSTNAALAITANGSTLDGCTIDGTGAAYALELGTSVTAITLTDCTITAGSTDKVHVLKTTGTVTITISGTTSLVAGDVTSAGATVVIAAPNPTLDATVLANTRAVLWNRTMAAELDNTFAAGTSWSKTITSGASSGDVLDLYAFKEGYAEAVATIIYGGVDATFAIEQTVDDAIDYYRTQESITDYTTLTEYNFYSPDIYIQADDADGENTLKKLFIFYNGVLTTEDGARYMRGGVTFRSPFDVVINRSTVAMAVDNVSVTHGLHFTDEATIRVTTDDGSSWIAPPSAPGSIRYAFGVSPGQVTTSDSVVTGTPSTVAAAVLSAAASTPIAANVKQMNDETMIGDGSEGDKFRSHLVA